MKAIPCPIDPSELKRLYHDAKLTDLQIAGLLGANTTVKHIRSWRRRFSIETINRTARHNVPAIEGDLRSLLVGSMLGDGRLSRGVHTTRYIENHAVEQRDYAEWKRQQWGAWVKAELKPVAWKRAEGDFPGVRFETVSHAILNEWQELFYPNPGPKILTDAVLPLIKNDPLALAIWFMDDGCGVTWWPMITIAEASAEIGVSILNGFGLTCRRTNDTTTTSQLIIEGEKNAERFLDLIEPFVPECMRYKLAPNFRGPHYQVRARVTEAKLRELSAKGVPIKRIARELGVGEGTVHRRLEAFEIDHPRKLGRPI